MELDGTSRDILELDNMLDDEVAYVPTFNRNARTQQNKNLFREPSTKSIEPLQPLPVAAQRSMAVTDPLKDRLKKGAISFQDFFKQQNQDKQPEKQKQSNKTLAQKQPARLIGKNNATSNDLELRNILDEDDQPIQLQRKMKPPINRRNQDNKSVNSMDQRHQSTPNNLDLSNPKTTVVPTKEVAAAESKQAQQSNDEYDKHAKQFMASQMELQRQGVEKLLAEERENHQREVNKLMKMHDEEVSKRLELKEFEIRQLKEFYEMQLRVKSERAVEAVALTSMSKKIEDNLKMMEKMESEIRSTHAKGEDSRKKELESSRQRQDETYKQREKQLEELSRQIDFRERGLKEEKQRVYICIESDRRRLQEQENRLIKRQSDLEVAYRAKEKALAEENQRNSQAQLSEASQLRMKSIKLEEERRVFEEEKEQQVQSIKRHEESRKAVMEELSIDKTKVMHKEIEVTKRLNQVAMRENETQIIQRDLINKLKLIELERKKIDLDREHRFIMGSKQSNFNAITKVARDEPQQSMLEKSIKELKDQYLKGLNQRQ